MISRLRYKRNFRYVVRYFSDKPSDSEGKVPENNSTAKSVKKSDANMDKIQELLKLMMAEPKIKDSDYKDKFTTAPVRPKKQRQIDENEVTPQNIEAKITKAASEVASALGGDVKHTEAELLSRVLGKINQTSTSLSDLIVGMKVDRTKETEDIPSRETRGQQVKRQFNKATSDQQRTRYMQRKASPDDVPQQKELRKRSVQATPVDIFSGSPLGIFKPTLEPRQGTALPVWERMKQRDLALAVSQPPANYFQKMIQWTEQGKVWKFPIDNEQGLEEERGVHFSEHVFLDALLQGWCPARGPLRHFMELVCAGLSKNAFYTVNEKRDHIMWYKQYFESKKDLLSEIGAWDTAPTKQTSTQT